MLCSGLTGCNQSIIECYNVHLRIRVFIKYIECWSSLFLCDWSPDVCAVFLFVCFLVVTHDALSPFSISNSEHSCLLPSPGLAFWTQKAKLRPQISRDQSQEGVLPDLETYGFQNCFGPETIFTFNSHAIGATFSIIITPCLSHHCMLGVLEANTLLLSIKGSQMEED